MATNLGAYASALVQAPANLLAEARRGGTPIRRLAVLAALSMVAMGLVVASFSGGLQFVFVPLKLVAGMFICALLCLPSLYVFSSVAGGSQSLRDTMLALVMGVALIGVLLVALAPVAWLFSQTTSSQEVMGTLHVIALLGTSLLGIGLISRTMRAYNGKSIRGVYLWGMVFVAVLLQMTATLRPLVGPYEGAWIQEKRFFLDHWAASGSEESLDGAAVELQMRDRL